jgi:hypothetical protein
MPSERTIRRADICMTPGLWYTEGLASGYVSGQAGGFQTFATQTSITDHAGGGQANATDHCDAGADLSLRDDRRFRPVAARKAMEVTVVNNGAASANAFAAGAGQGGQGGGDTMNGTANGSAAIAAASVPVLLFCKRGMGHQVSAIDCEHRTMPPLFPDRQRRSARRRDMRATSTRRALRSAAFRSAAHRGVAFAASVGISRPCCTTC